MSEITPGLDAALSGDRVPMAGLLRIDFLDSRTLRLVDGAGVLNWGGDLYVGRDDTFGALQSVDEIDDGTGDEAPALSLSLFPAGDTAAEDLCAADMQGSRVRLWLAAFDRTDGTVIPDPYLVFDGDLDVATLRLARGSRVVDYDCVSGFERFFANEEGMRLNPTFHQSIWPGETGLNKVTGIIEQKYWGQNPPNPGVSVGSSFGDLWRRAAENTKAKGV
jgi:hypothetical protein